MRFLIVALLLLTAGCGSVATTIGPPSREDDVRVRCQQHGGWWHSGYCEFKAASG